MVVMRRNPRLFCFNSPITEVDFHAFSAGGAGQSEHAALTSAGEEARAGCPATGPARGKRENRQ